MSIWLEVLKLLAQLCGAIVIAKLAVQWALDRFKSEKAWERQVVALVDVITAMGAMERVVRRWLDDHYSDTDSTPEYMVHLRKLHRDAELKLQEVSAAARLVLPRRLADVIESVEQQLKSTDDCPTYEEMLSIDLSTLEKLSEELIQMGRSIFDADRVPPPDPILHPILFLKHRNEIRLSYAEKN